jgi:hypothetical protein
MFDIKTSRDFYEKLLDDYYDFQQDESSARLAINCAITAYHMHEWVWGDYSVDDRRRRRPRRRPVGILSDAAYLIFTKPAKSFTGQFLIDDTFLAGEGVTDFDVYRVDPSQPLSPDFFVPDSSKPPPGVSLAAKA